ncbi:MAG: dTDP-4-dehydrorhamnose 3,5-epimerase [Candidatus Marinimicrobia bacterium]|nr:dTDP-4-dehydrorhamnose 3,5-epimerase [Candidatus Neomarinimicrobiota bacterium]MBT3618072.1 dTDP-4-dehydrorhamnose 3,5-epimerase [Candidatus Neomarinimicrobiota bacterium]MBT3828471.1 dTDP-4-dehydrorhamnose 3,5-epimerase [Candidatus Neomarinimicrobiota bacterium]MBT3998058.1 dTDP-4-dehydrorhamnose 3,5-epimerase [Candidatus Neomarinimicrobiota bacterium]MBT4280238.1 dTDP-4-dehydrorhamnose 3,5-epimerase [Candidatus Neomarinimicrobiota bacterium]
MKVETTPIDGLIVLQPNVLADDRGFFMEAFKKSVFNDFGIKKEFVQDNHSRSSKHVIRGIHFQWNPPMGKLMRVTRGCAFLVAVDIRHGSPTLGEWVGREVNEENKVQIYAPAGFARGFCSLSEITEIQYKCTGEYNAAGEGGILWNDPEIGIEWPIDNPVLSDKDKNAQSLSDWLNTAESQNFSV